MSSSTAPSPSAPIRSEEDWGPDVLGRGLIVGLGQPVPGFFADCDRFLVTTQVLLDPRPVADAMHRLWVKRRRFVVELDVDPAIFKQALHEIDERDPFEVGARFVFHAHRLHFLTWNNNWDLRSGEPIWWWGRKATACGTAASDIADVLLPDGRHAFVDGGPVAPVSVGDGLVVVPYTAVEQQTLQPFPAFTEPDSVLADDQRRAVLHEGGAARIIAPAGAGKTRVLTSRFRRLLEDWHLSPATVTAVAYNTRAADEMKQRTADSTAHIRTLNSLALAVVNGTGGFARTQLEPHPRRMITERDVRSILQNLVELPRRMNTDPFAQWIEALSSVRLGLQSPESVEEESGDLDGFADVFDRYRSHLRDASLLDFDEQIYRAIEVLLQDPVARMHAQRRCRSLLVDEFQDLTPAHLLMVRLLASPALDIFGVGDDDQVIYGYAGADPEYLVKFDELFPGAVTHALEVNYRCPPAVVTGASNLLTRNAPRVAKTIRAAPGRAVDAAALRVEQREGAELAQRAADLIEEWLGEGIRPDEIAVLSRVNVTLLPVQVVLEHRQVPHTAPVDASLLQRTGISTALAYLRIGITPTAIRRNEVQATVHRPSRKIARNVVDMMTKRASTSINDLRRLGNGLTGKDSTRVGEYATDLQGVANAVRTRSTSRALDVIRNDIGLGEVMGVLDSSRREADRSTHGDDLAALVAVAHLNEEPESFEPWLRDALDRPGANDGVHLSTVHKVKGREWKRVIVYDAGRRLFPHTLATDVGEERRVFHVAITRCSERVVILADREEPSPFLSELAAPGEPAPVRPKRNTPASPSSPSADKPRTGGTATLPVEVGMTVSIPGGMEGTIVEVGERAAVVASGKVRMGVDFGTEARVHGKMVTLAPPLDPATRILVEALRNWRRSAAAETKVPAYTVLHDAHIESIARTKPTTLKELSVCKGIGASKLERWGDDILAAIEAADSTT